MPVDETARMHLMGIDDDRRYMPYVSGTSAIIGVAGSPVAPSNNVTDETIFCVTTPFASVPDRLVIVGSADEKVPLHPTTRRRSLVS
jgi:hypothetical protein